MEENGISCGRTPRRWYQGRARRSATSGYRSIHSSEPLACGPIEEIGEFYSALSDQPHFGSRVAFAECLNSVSLSRPTALDFKRPDPSSMGNHEVHFGITIAPIGDAPIGSL